VPAEPQASTGTTDRRSDAGGTIALTKQSRPPYTGGSRMRWFRPVLVMIIAAAVLLAAIVALRSRRRING
jgi:hypothetical protein